MTFFDVDGPSSDSEIIRLEGVDAYYSSADSAEFPSTPKVAITSGILYILEQSLFCFQIFLQVQAGCKLQTIDL